MIAYSIIGFLVGVILAGLFYSFKLKAVSKLIINKDNKTAMEKVLEIGKYLNKIGEGIHGASPEGAICIALMDFIYHDKPLIDNNEEK